MELIDILDASGKPTGSVKPKADVHRDGDWHKCAHVWIMNSKQEVLIQKRAASKENYPNRWDDSSAGHVSAGETSLVSAMRETEEELGVKLEEHDFEYLFTASQQVVLNNGAYIENEFDDIFLVQLDIDTTTLKLQEEEVAEAKFIAWRDLEKIIEQGGSDFFPHPSEYEQLFAELRRRYP